MVQNKKKVLVALSGGVDSSVAAALLQEATPNNFEELFGRPAPEGFRGYEVEGAFIITWQAPWLPCTWREERLDAMRVAARLRIPFHTIDLSHEYEHDVVDYLVREYRMGRTPNPDVMCNKYVKFGAFFDWAMAQGFDYVATGHYARVRSMKWAVSSEESDVGPGGNTNNSLLETRHSTLDTQNSKLETLNSLLTPHFSLLTGIDTNKDQSYFLWTLTQRHLAHTLFPVGEFEKPHVRELAEKFGLPTAQKKDSQGVCFLGKIDMKEFLQHYIPPQTGDVIDGAGRVLGSHDGAAFVTLGQRHGFEVTAQSPDTPPLYVIAKDVTNNTITVAPQYGTNTLDQLSSVILTDVNWINPVFSSTFNPLPRTAAARYRYRQPLIPCTIAQDKSGHVCVTFNEPQRYVPIGQSVVLYDGDVCLGGGIIDCVPSVAQASPPRVS